MHERHLLFQSDNFTSYPVLMPYCCFSITSLKFQSSAFMILQYSSHVKRLKNVICRSVNDLRMFKRELLLFFFLIYIAFVFCLLIPFSYFDCTDTSINVDWLLFVRHTFDPIFLFLGMQ